MWAAGSKQWAENLLTADCGLHSVYGPPPAGVSVGVSPLGS